MYKVVVHKPVLDSNPFIVDTFEQAIEMADRFREMFLVEPGISIFYIG